MVTVSESDIRALLETVYDPEIPTISIVDLGIVTKIEQNNNKVKVTLTPTFSGCPALKVMEDLVRSKLETQEFESIEVVTSFETTWTTNLISEKGLIALKKHGLAPPPRAGLVELDVLSDIECPLCGSRNTTMQTPFGPTLCRSMHYCKNCHNGFEAFKPV